MARSKDAKVRCTDTTNARGGKASSKQRPKLGTKPTEDEEVKHEDTLQHYSSELLQLMLNIFRDCFSDFSETTLTSLIQEIKHHLFNRRFDQAFGRQDLLEAYATRWSPSRALAYLDIICSVSTLSAHLNRALCSASLKAKATHIAPILTSEFSAENHVEPQKGLAKSDSATEKSIRESVHIACLGAGAGAEVVAFAGYLHHLHATARKHDTSADQAQSTSGIDLTPMASIVVQMLDIADWSTVLGKLYSSTTKSPPLSKYASSTLKSMNGPLVEPENFRVSFGQKDLLNTDAECLAAVVRDAAVVTLMFTLNELYSTSMSKATNLLLNLTYLMQPGSLLLVVDSPGSYSIVNLGKDVGRSPPGSAKKYPMQWLLDHTLMDASKIGDGKDASQGNQWEKVVSEDSKWFRLPQGLKYPLDLEDMRYQLHLYRRL
ncbi:MAG: hypothetical protein Q9187_004770 [Circinaria calcarea]